MRKIVVPTFKVFILAFLTLTLVSYSSSLQAQVVKENKDEIVQTLRELAQYEIDGSFIIGQSIDKVNNRHIINELTKMREQSENYIKRLSDFIRQYGGDVPSHSRDFKGFFMQGYVAMRGIASDQGVMKALHTNLQMILRAFESALKAQLPKEVRQEIQKIYEQNKKHLDYVASQM